MLRNPTFAICAAALVLFWPVALLLPRDILFDAINSIGIMLGFGVLWAYWPGVVDAFRSFRSGALDRGHFLIMGVFVTWLAMVGRTIWIWTWRWLGEPAGGLDTIWMAFVAQLIVVGGILHLLSPKVLEGRVPRDGWFNLQLALLLGAVLFLALAGLRIWEG